MLENFKLLKDKLSDKCTGEVSESTLFTIKEICDICKPTNILEVGFNRGNSALMWLLGSNAKLTSIDVRKKISIEDSLNVLNENYGERFEYIKKDGYLELHLMNGWVNKFDLIFIDTWHVPIGYEVDTLTAKYLGCNYIIYDDYTTHRNAGFIQNYVKKDSDLEEIKKYNTNQGIVKIVNDRSGDENILNLIKEKVKTNIEQFNNLKLKYDK